MLKDFMCLTGSICKLLPTAPLPVLCQGLVLLWCGILLRSGSVRSMETSRGLASACFDLVVEFKLVQQSKRFVPGSLVGIKDIDFVGRSEAETP